MAIEVAYNRRTWGHFFVTDNRALRGADYDRVSLTAPLNPLLPAEADIPSRS